MERESLKEILERAVKDNGEITQEEIANRARKSHLLDFKALVGLAKNYHTHKDLRENDKYKHAFLNCQAAQSGMGGALIGEFLSGLREKKDVLFKTNTPEESEEDNYANILGRYLGFKYPNGDCDEMLQRYIQKKSE